MKATIPLLLAWSLAACSIMGPDERDADLDRVRTSLQVSPSSVVAGQPVTLTLTLTNTGSETIELGTGCGVPLAFVVTDPDGRRSLAFPLAGPCVTTDFHTLDPGETDVFAPKWTAPAQLGTYRIRAGVPRSYDDEDGWYLAVPTSAQSVRVQGDVP